jgi:NAD(P)-dependent dehydrogenase (short-subunit alcohol dehydrogenase family)
MTPQPSPPRCLVITGASKGIGLATATRFAAAGYQVINLSRTDTSVPGAVQMTVDLSNPSSIESISKPLLAAVEGFPVITLVHNAALQTMGSIKEAESEQLRAMFEVNVVAPVTLNQMLLPTMQPGSSVIYIGSTMSHRATRNLTGYIATKHATLGLMRSTCQDLAGTGVHTCCICPGFTETEMLRSFGGDVLKHLASLTTQQRIASTSEIANLVHFAAENPVVNGAALNADLGFIEP